MAKVTSGQLYAAKNTITKALSSIYETKTDLENAKKIILEDQSGKIVSAIEKNLIDKITKLELASSYLSGAAKSLEKYASALSKQESIEAREKANLEKISQAQKRIERRTDSTLIS